MSKSGILKIVFFFGLSYSLSTSLPAQCPDRDVLFKRILFLQDRSAVSSETQLSELLGYYQEFEKCNEKKDTIYALLLLRIGVMYYSQSDFTNAISFTRKSLNTLYEDVKNSYKTEYLQRGYYNLSIYYDSLVNNNKKEEAIDSCIDISFRTERGYYYACLMMEEKVNRLFSIGDYSSCVRAAYIGEILCKTYYHEKDSLYVSAFFVSKKANSLEFLKEYDQAEEILREFLKKISAKPVKDLLASVYALLGLVNKDQKKYHEAFDYFKQAYEINLSVKYAKGVAEFANQIGILYYDFFHKPDSAFFYYQKALAYADPGDSLYILPNLARFYSDKYNFDSANVLFTKGFHAISPHLQLSALYSHPEVIKDYLAEYTMNLIIQYGHTQLAELKYVKSNRNSSEVISIFKIADFLINKIKISQDEPSRLFWRSHIQSLYEGAIEAAYLKQDMDAAFYFFERSRAVLLNDEINGQHYLTGADLQKKANLSREIVDIGRLLATKAFSTEYIRAQYRILKINQELLGVEQTMKRTLNQQNSGLAEQAFLNTNNLQKSLAKNRQSLVELYYGDSALYIFFAGNGQSRLTRVNKDSFDSILNLYITSIRNPENLNKRYTEFSLVAARLYELIFQDNQLLADRVIISPGGKFFPFEALVISPGNSKPVYFIEKYSISYTYSASFLFKDFYSTKGDAAGSFAGFAPVNYPASFSLSSLPGSVESLTRLSGYFKDGINLNLDAATKKGFVQNYFKYRIIQLYTHASESSDNGEPVIYFADSALYLSDLIDEHRPRSRLIVLSACETALGKEIKGEGVFSFNRGFAALGIPSSVTNLWTIDNESTYKLTELFYKYVAKGLPLDEALQRAKLEFIKTSSKEKQLPYYWAAAILVGSTDSIPIAARTGWPYLGLTLVVIVSFIVLYMMSRKRKQNRSIII